MNVLGGTVVAKIIVAREGRDQVHKVLSGLERLDRNEGVPWRSKAKVDIANFITDVLGKGSKFSANSRVGATIDEPVTVPCL